MPTKYLTNITNPVISTRLTKAERRCFVKMARAEGKTQSRLLYDIVTKRMRRTGFLK